MFSTFLLLIALMQAAPAKQAADPFATATPAQMNSYRAVLETSKGNVTLEVMADKAPETVRYFLQLAAAGSANAHRPRVIEGFIRPARVLSPASLER